MWYFLEEGRRSGVPLELPSGLPTVRLLGRRGVFIVSRDHTRDRRVEPLGVYILGLVPLGVAARASLIELLSGAPLRLRICFVGLGDRAPGGAPVRRVVVFCGSFTRLSGRGFSNVVIANTPVRAVRCRRIRC